MSVDVEHVFRHGRLVLSHVCSHMSVQTTCALLCLNSWIKHGYMKNHDVLSVTSQPEIDEEVALDLNWDKFD